MWSEFLRLEIDLSVLAGAIESAVGIRYTLTPLAVKCTYPVFRGEAEGKADVFVKIGTKEEWNKTAALLRDLGECAFFSSFLSDRPLEYAGYAVFVMTWREAKCVRPEDMNDRQLQSFASACVSISAALQRARDYVALERSPNDPDRLYETVKTYVRRHPIAGKLLAALVELPAAERSYSGHELKVMHGDFHAKNFGFDGDEFAALYDFDKLTQGLGCSDFMNALVERFSSHSLSSAARARLKAATRKLVALVPWTREELVIGTNAVRLWFAARRLAKHPSSAWVAFDVCRRDRKIREILECIQ